MNFGKTLKKLRESNGYSMTDLIELYNKRFSGRMNKSTLSRYENGLQEPMFYVVVNLADLFNVSVDYLCGNVFNDNIISIEPIQHLSTDENELVTNFRKLNVSGKEKASEYITDLTTMKKYIDVDVKSKLG